MIYTRKEKLDIGKNIKTWGENENIYQYQDAGFPPDGGTEKAVLFIPGVATIQQVLLEIGKYL